MSSQAETSANAPSTFYEQTNPDTSLPNPAEQPKTYDDSHGQVELFIDSRLSPHPHQVPSPKSPNDSYEPAYAGKYVLAPVSSNPSSLLAHETVPRMFAEQVNPMTGDRIELSSGEQHPSIVKARERTRCFDWATLGTCRFSTDCRFAHNSEARKEYCSDFLRGSCTRPNCKFFHEDPLANQPPQPLDLRGKERDRDVVPRNHPPRDRERDRDSRPSADLRRRADDYPADKQAKRHNRVHCEVVLTVYHPLAENLAADIRNEMKEKSLGVGIEVVTGPLNNKIADLIRDGVPYVAIITSESAIRGFVNLRILKTNPPREYNDMYWRDAAALMMADAVSSSKAKKIDTDGQERSRDRDRDSRPRTDDRDRRGHSSSDLRDNRSSRDARRETRDDRDGRDERRRNNRITDDYPDDRRRDERSSRLKESDPERLSSRTRDYDPDRTSSHVDLRRSAFEERNHSIDRPRESEKSLLPVAHVEQLASKIRHILQQKDQPSSSNAPLYQERQDGYRETYSDYPSSQPRSDHLGSAPHHVLHGSNPPHSGLPELHARLDPRLSHDPRGGDERGRIGDYHQRPQLDPLHPQPDSYQPGYMALPMSQPFLDPREQPYMHDPRGVVPQLDPRFNARPGLEPTHPQPLLQPSFHLEPPPMFQGNPPLLRAPLDPRLHQPGQPSSGFDPRMIDPRSQFLPPRPGGPW